MNSSTIELVVSLRGEVRLETHGFQGSACQDASRFLQQALGQTTAEQLTPAYYLVPETHSTGLQQQN